MRPLIPIVCCLVGSALAGCTTQSKLRRTFVEGIEHQRLGRHDEARQRYDEILAVDPTYPGARTNRAVIDAQTGQLDAALEALRQEVRRHGDLRAARLDEAMILLLKGDVAAAAGKARPLAEAAPADPVSHLVLGLALLQTGDAPEEAVDAFAVVIAGDRDALKADAHFGRGVIRARQGEHAAAVEDFAAVTSLRPDAVAHYNRAVVLGRLNQLPEAHRAIAASAELDQKAAQIPLQAARLHLQAGDDTSALAALERAVALNPDLPGQALIAGVLAYRARQFDRALEAFAKAADEAPAAPAPHFNRGLTYLAIDDLAGAHAAFAEAARRAPDDADAAHNRDVLAKLLGSAPE